MLRRGGIDAFSEQECVDQPLGLDMVSLGVNRSVEVVYLLSSDNDLTEAVVQAQDLGLQVELISLPSADNLERQAVAEHLLLAAEGGLTFLLETIARTVTHHPADQHKACRRLEPSRHQLAPLRPHQHRPNLRDRP